MTLLEFAQDFQTAIVGVIGFTGVICAQFVNAHLQRKRDDKALEKKRKAVTAAFEVELKIQASFFREMDPEKLPKEGTLAMRPRAKRIVTPSLIDEIGYVETDSLEDVLYALLVIDTFDIQCALFASSQTETHLGFNAEMWPQVAGGGQNAAGALDKAIASLHSANA